jgi:hypothetical protein
MSRVSEILLGGKGGKIKKMKARRSTDSDEEADNGMATKSLKPKRTYNRSAMRTSIVSEISQQEAAAVPAQSRRSGRSKRDRRFDYYGDEVDTEMEVQEVMVSTGVEETSHSAIPKVPTLKGTTPKLQKQQQRLAAEIAYCKQVTMFWSDTDKFMQPLQDGDVSLLRDLAASSKSSWISLIEV